MNTLYTYGVSDFINNLKITLTESFPSVCVLGEVSQINFHEKSGHLYFNIKDDKNSLNCVVWKSQVSSFLSIIKEGEIIKVIGKITIFPNSSKIYLNGVYLSKHSQGNITQNLIELKNKLTKEGLFQSQHKKKITRFPSKIGLITSKDGAVIEDIKTTLKDAYPTKILLINSNMQGQHSVADIILAIDTLNNLTNKPDFILIARGGGSKEDLFHFNDEDLVRAIFNSQIPIVTAIGHDNDISLADLVSDMSKSTPSIAASWIAKKNDITEALHQKNQLLKHYIELKLHFDHNKLLSSQKALLKPQQIIETFKYKIKQLDSLLTTYPAKLKLLSNNLNNAYQSLKIYKNTLNYLKSKLINKSTLLEELSFKKTLLRGFALLYDNNSNIIKDANQIVDGNYIIELGNNKKNIKISINDN